MNNLLSVTVEKIQNVVQQKGSVTLSQLETTLDTSFNLIFLALDELSRENKIHIKRRERDYVLSR
jgi:hypothetical protein